MFTAVVGANAGRFLVPGVIWELSFLLPSQGQQICEPLTIPLCQGLEYNATIFPNMLNHKSQEEAAVEVRQFFSFGENGLLERFGVFSLFRVRSVLLDQLGVEVSSSALPLSL